MRRMRVRDPGDPQRQANTKEIRDNHLKPKT
jgi:hypothetical protein